MSHTHIRHRDYSFLIKAITKLKAIAFYINEQKRSAEKDAHWNEICSKLTGINIKVLFKKKKEMTSGLLKFYLLIGTEFQAISKSWNFKSGK